jgi:tetratricopeptide (TPR) repeat protein
VRISSQFLTFTFSLCLGALTVKLCLVGPGEAQTGQLPLDGPVAEGVKLIAKGQFAQAVEALNRAKQQNIKDARPYFYCGMALAQEGRLPDAASELVEAVHLAPDNLDYRVFQAHVLQQLVQYKAAEQTLAPFQDDGTVRRLLPSWLQLLADVYYRMGNMDDALRILNLWAASDPHNANIDLYRGQAYVMKSEPDVAFKYFQTSIAESAQNPQAYFEMGKILYQRSNFAAAQEALAKAVQQDPNNPEYRSKLASDDLALRDPDAALACLQPVEAFGDKFPAIYYDLGRSYRAKGNATRADDYLKKFQEITTAERNKEDQRDAIDRPIGQAERLLEQGHTAEAQALFQKVLQVAPDRWEPNAYLAEMDLNDGNLQAALPLLQKLQKLDPDSPTGNFLLARYWVAEHNYAHARVFAEKVKIKRPDNSALRAMLGDIYARLGERQKALTEYRAALSLDPRRQDLRQRVAEEEGRR